MRLLMGLPFLAVTVFFLYEWLAVSFVGLGLPSVSALVANQISPHPAFAFLEGMGAGALIVLLAFHFAGALPWWRP